MISEREAEIAERILATFREEKLSKNEGWLILLTLCASCAAESGMTWKQASERFAKAFAIYKRLYTQKGASA